MANSKYAGEVTMRCSTSCHTRFRNMAISIATFALGIGLIALSGHAQSNNSKANQREVNLTQTTATQKSNGQTAGKDAIRPFHVSIPKEAIDKLRRRIADTQWPEKETVADSSQGVPLATMQELARYWSTDYDWRKAEAKLNALPQFVTTIDGLDIHFIHVRSHEKNALPLIITHGWPGSVLEQIKLIAPLTDPTAHGGKADDAFHVIIPSMPGYGFSAKPTSTGWGPERMGRAWAELMKRLGYTRYCGARRRLGCVCRRSDGFAGTSGTTCHPHQHACYRSRRSRQSAPGRRPAAIRSLSRGTARV